MEEKKPSSSSNPAHMTVEQIFEEYLGRRAGLIRALTEDVDTLYELCDPRGAKKLCLFGNPDGSWEVCPQFEEVPPVIPEPLRGINILRKNMDRKDWITKVSLYSDAWLISVTFYYTIWSLLDQDKRDLLYSHINSKSNVSEAVDAWKGPAKDNTGEASGSKSRSSAKKSNDGRGKQKMVKESDAQNDICGMCTGRYRKNEFWIECTECQVWSHGKCVNVTINMVETMLPHVCPPCLMERSNQSKKRDRS